MQIVTFVSDRSKSQADAPLQQSLMGLSHARLMRSVGPVTHVISPNEGAIDGDSETVGAAVGNAEGIPPVSDDVPDVPELGRLSEGDLLGTFEGRKDGLVLGSRVGIAVDGGTDGIALGP